MAESQTTDVVPGVAAKVDTPQAAPNPEGYDQKVEDEAKRLASGETTVAEGPASLERRAMEHSVSAADHQSLQDRVEALEALVAELKARLLHYIY